jgi:hypothetical protein
MVVISDFGEREKSPRKEPVTRSLLDDSCWTDKGVLLVKQGEDQWQNKKFVTLMLEGLLLTHL